MKISLILIFLIIFSFVIVLTDGSQEKELHITSLDIKFDKTDAIFTVNYDFDKLSKTFLLIFGAQTLEPRIRYIFSDFEYEIIKIDPERTILRVNNISILNKGYYLHYSHKFGDTIDTVYISDPSSTRIREYTNINSTPNYFYR